MVASRTSFPRTCPARPSLWAARASARGYTELTMGRTLPSATSREILVSVSAFGSTLKYRIRIPRRSASALTSSGTSAGRATRTPSGSTRRGTAVGRCRRPCRSRHAPAPPTSRTSARGSRRTRHRRASSRTPGWNRTRLRQQRCRRLTGDDRQIATAERLADEGAHVWAVDRDARLLADLVSSASPKSRDQGVLRSPVAQRVRTVTEPLADHLEARRPSDSSRVLVRAPYFTRYRRQRAGAPATDTSPTPRVRLRVGCRCRTSSGADP